MAQDLFWWNQTVPVWPDQTQLWQSSSHHPLQRSPILGLDKTHSMQVSPHLGWPCGKRRGSDMLCTHKWYGHRHSNQSTYTWSALEVHQSHGLTTVLKWECQELNNSRATPDYFPTLLWCTFPHYSGPPLDWTGFHSTCLLIWTWTLSLYYHTSHSHH